MKKILIDNRPVSREFPPYIVAELSANHHQNLQTALEAISEAKKRGADAIKLQTYTADSMTLNSHNKDFQITAGNWKGYSLYDLYQEAEMPYAWHKTLFDQARKVGITCFSTPFDEKAVDLLETLNVPAYKIASFEAIDLPLIKYTASTRKPLIVSTGMASLDEIEELVDSAKSAGCEQLMLLHCISSYPAPIDQSNLLTINDLRRRFNVEVGLSDHSLNNTAAVVATAIGASLIEKHFTLNRQHAGPDSSFSIEPAELEDLSIQTKTAWSALGQPSYRIQPAEQHNILFRRSIYFIKDMKAGDRITTDHIRRIRPGYGLPPKYEQHLIGKTVNKNIKRGTATSWTLIND